MSNVRGNGGKGGLSRAQDTEGLTNCAKKPALRSLGGGSTWQGAALNGFGLKGQGHSGCHAEVSLRTRLEARGVRVEAETQARLELQKPENRHKGLCREML